MAGADECFRWNTLKAQFIRPKFSIKQLGSESWQESEKIQELEDGPGDPSYHAWLTSRRWSFGAA